MKRLIELGFLTWVAATSATAQSVANQERSVMERAARLATGQFVWDSEASPTGSLFLLIDLTRQRVLLYRGGIPIAASTISSGSEGRETPTGHFTILQKKVVHRSRTYDDAPMPYMQRLTAKGVAMHAGDLPGYPASHGCIRLPRAFAKLLYGVTELGTPVMITDAEQELRAAERQRAFEEYQSAVGEIALEKARLQADAERALAEYDMAKTKHEHTLTQHKASMAKYEAEMASR